MDQEKFGEFIKNIRKRYHLTQRQLAEKYHVTYQAVSKWENGLNLPDMSLMKQISHDFGVSLDELINGEYKKKRIPIFIYVLVVFFVFLSFALCFFFLRPRDFQFKTLSATCDNFTISGTIAYNATKSAISITNISYCGGNDTEEYKKIECNLYEASGSIERMISSYSYDEEKRITLEEFLKNASLSAPHYETICKKYEEDSLYLLIYATSQEDKITTYKIPLRMESC